MTVQSKKEAKRLEIIKEMKKYSDNNGNIDLTRLRKENNKVYSKISYYFGSIDEALIECGLNAAYKSKNEASGAPLSRKTLRNALAYDMLVDLREKHTLEEIGNKYGCSRAYINQLYQSLHKIFGENQEETNKAVETNTTL